MPHVAAVHLILDYEKGTAKETDTAKTNQGRCGTTRGTERERPCDL